MTWGQIGVVCLTLILGWAIIGVAIDDLKSKVEELGEKLTNQTHA